MTSGDPARRRAAAEESQLIAMAQDGVQRLKTQRSKEEEERRIAAAGALEMEGFKALLPKKEAGGKGQGRLAFCE